MINKFEKIILEYVGKFWEAESWVLILFVIFFDPMRGRLFEWGPLQIVAMIYLITRILFSIWISKLLTTIKDILSNI